PDKAPAWLQDVVPWLLVKDLGCHFTALVAALVQLETAFKFDDGNGARIPETHRPDALNTWISHGRVSKTKKIPTILSVPKYADQYSLWWDSLQLTWQKRNKNGQWAFGGEVAYGNAAEWGKLDIPGQNGCLSVVSGLYIWGVCEQPANVREKWDAAVLDATWMLGGLALSMEDC
ncbi:hypothetical protein C8R43DRAFT_887448, partial [Mycena crocata]